MLIIPSWCTELTVFIGIIVFTAVCETYLLVLRTTLAHTYFEEASADNHELIHHKLNYRYTAHHEGSHEN